MVKEYYKTPTEAVNALSSACTGLSDLFDSESGDWCWEIPEEEQEDPEVFNITSNSVMYLRQYIDEVWRVKAQGERFADFWDRMGNSSPQDLYDMSRESTTALQDLRDYFLELTDKLVTAHDLDIAEDPDTERTTRKILENILVLSRQQWNMNYNEQEQEEEEYFLSTPDILLIKE